MQSQTATQGYEAFFELVYTKILDAIAQETPQTRAIFLAVYSTAMRCALDEGLEPLEAVKKAGAVTAKVLSGR